MVVPLPQKEVVTQTSGRRRPGTKQWWSGTDDDYDATLTRQVAVPAGSPTLTFQARWNIEDCGPDPCDYAYVEVDDGTGWKAIPGSITKAAEGNGIDGVSGWVPATFDLSAYAGKTVGLRLHYRTDGAVQGQDPNAVGRLLRRRVRAHRRLHRRRRERQRRLDAGRLRGRRRHEVDAVRQLLHRLEPDVRVL